MQIDNINSYNIKHFESLAEAIYSLFGKNVTIAKSSYVGGGDINDSYRLLLSDGTSIFMKQNTSKVRSFFDAEALGLFSIKKTETIHVPKVFATGFDKDKSSSFLLLEYIERGNSSISYWKELAKGLAAMHKADASSFVKDGKYGFLENNYIGETDQINSECDSFIMFFRNCRLMPQIKMAARYLNSDDLKCAERLLERLDDVLIEPEYPSLLHGDLWGGNVMAGKDGTAYLIDPAVYVGCNEADIAMTQLFGGFPSVFYSTYEEFIPLKEGYNKRKNVYNLYHMLNHLNLFGSGYLPSVLNLLRSITV